MAGGGNQDILPQIQALVSDKLQVVSYKWLSRNFLVSSNHAKRLLQEFVDKHGNELEVIYTLSGWSKVHPQVYHIRLASGINLTEMKEEFLDNCSVQVYSVQTCIPKDPAMLWSAEFVQAEELFNQPSTAENCLRDNRFCGVSNLFVTRTIDGRPAGVTSHLINSMGAATQPKACIVSNIPLQKPPEHGQVGQSDLKNGITFSNLAASTDKRDKTLHGARNQTSDTHDSNSHMVKVVSGAAQGNNKRKVQSEKMPSECGGSLANLWGRASTKSKPTTPAALTDNFVPKVAFSSEAQICARETVDATSSDDDGQQMTYKRESNGGSNRKRKVIMDFSDDDEEDVVNLASPDPSTRCSILDSEKAAEELVSEKRSLIFEEYREDALEVEKNDMGERNSRSTTGNSCQDTTQGNAARGLVDNDKKDNSNFSSTLPQRRKVLKTRIDERGREVANDLKLPRQVMQVTEVVWEGDAADAKAAEKKNGIDDPGNRALLASKSPAAGIIASSKPVNKAVNKKAAKGSGKDAKQGNILSFFKRV